MRFNTSLGNIDVQMLSDEAPKNVANFLSYVNGTTNNYTNSIIHRSIPPSFGGSIAIIQGGEVDVVNSQLAIIGSNGSVQGEPGVSNVRGTIAMALSEGPTSPDTGTNNWFFNLTDDTGLDTAAIDPSSGQQTGPFTVFGRVANPNSLAVMDALGALPVLPGLFQADPGDLLYDLPLINYTPNPVAYTPGSPSPAIQFANLVYINSITTFTTTNYAAWEAPFQSDPNAATDSLPAATPQNDNTSNLLKYVCGITANAPMTAADRAKLPAVTMTKLAGVNQLTMTYHLRTNLVDASANVQTSSDLVNWATPTNATTSTATDGTGDTIVQVPAPSPATATTPAALMFIRLNVTQ